MTTGHFFLPGPTEVRPEVLQAMVAPMLPHRGRAFEQLFARIQDGLRVVFDTTRPVYIGSCSATGMMEAGIRCAPAGRVLGLVNGAFSGRFAHIARACGREVDTYDVEWGEAHDPDELARRLERGDYSVVTVVHSETSTGVLNDVRRLSDVAHRFGARCLVDSVTGVGGAELHTDEWELDYVLTGSQKAIALPPGLAFAVATDAFIREAADVPDRGVYFDLVEFEAYARKHQAPNTPSLSLYYALARQLDDIAREGMEARWARHRAMAERTYAWVDDMRAAGFDIAILAPAGHRSPTVSTITLPSWLPSATLVPMVADRGYVIGAGYGKLRDTTFRIGHMGDHTVQELDGCLAVVSQALETAREGTGADR